jgi:hypothetical protein
VAAFISNTSEDGSRDGDAMKFITAIVGLISVIVTLPAILAAGRNIELQQHVYFSGIITEGEFFDYPCRRMRLTCFVNNDTHLPDKIWNN